ARSGGSAQTGLAAAWSGDSVGPTVVGRSSGASRTVAMEAASTRARRRGVPRTGTSPLPSTAAVSSSFTVVVTRPTSPGAGRGIGGLLDLADQVAVLDDVTLGDLQLGDPAGDLGGHGDLHLHGLQDDESVVDVDGVTFGDDDLPDVRDHLRMHLLSH